MRGGRGGWFPCRWSWWYGIRFGCESSGYTHFGEEQLRVELVQLLLHGVVLVSGENFHPKGKVDGSVGTVAFHFGGLPDRVSEVVVFLRGCVETLTDGGQVFAALADDVVKETAGGGLVGDHGGMVSGLNGSQATSGAGVGKNDMKVSCALCW